METKREQMSYFLNLSTLNQSLIMFSYYLFHQRANLTRVNQSQQYIRKKWKLSSCENNPGQRIKEELWPEWPNLAQRYSFIMPY